MRTPMLPWTNASTGEVVLQPMYLLNPGLEAVYLERNDDEQWHVKLPNQFTAAGLVHDARQISERPIEEATVRLADDGVALTMENLPTQTYVCAADEAYREQVRARGGVMLIVTHALNPSIPLRGDDLLQVLDDHRTVAGWVPLAEVREKQPRRPAPSNPAKTGTTYMLHRSPRHLAVGPLLGHNPATLSPEQAQQWAEQLIGCETMIGWDSTIGGEPASGWFNIDAISVAQYVLMQYPDGWRVLRALSRVAGGGGAETDTEAKVWADKVVKFKDQVTGLQWAPGPTPDGAITLYAVA
jgi:hypothetical protein